MQYHEIVSLLGDEAAGLLEHVCTRVPNTAITLPGPEKMATVFSHSDRSQTVVASLQRLHDQGDLSGTGYLSIFPVDQGVEHSAAYSFYHNPQFFDPEYLVETAVAGRVSGVVSTLGTLGLVAKKYASVIPLIVKINHNELLTYPNKHDQVMFATVQQAAEMGAAGVGATVYFGSPESNRQLVEVSRAFAEAHRLGLFTILWCYARNDAFTTAQGDYATAVDITAQANYLGVTVGADIIKQKLPNALHGFADLKFSKSEPGMYEALLTDHPVDLVRYQVLHCYAGKIGLINSGGEAHGDSDLASAVRAAVINKRAGGSGMIMGRKVFNKSFDQGVELLRAVHSVYLEPRVTVA